VESLACFFGVRRSSAAKPALGAAFHDFNPRLREWNDVLADR
jgi:hypothetical protein